VTITVNRLECCINAQEKKERKQEAQIKTKVVSKII
jgi:hypothetical protein